MQPVLRDIFNKLENSISDLNLSCAKVKMNEQIPWKDVQGEFDIINSRWTYFRDSEDTGNSDRTGISNAQLQKLVLYPKETKSSEVGISLCLFIIIFQRIIIK